LALYIQEGASGARYQGILSKVFQLFGSSRSIFFSFYFLDEGIASEADNDGVRVASTCFWTFGASFALSICFSEPGFAGLSSFLGTATFWLESLLLADALYLGGGF